MVIEQGPGGERGMDIWSLLLRKRIIFLQGEITEHSANSIVAQLLYLESVNPKESIHMYINSPGGLVTAGMAIFDTMNYISPPIETFAAGQAASMASFLLAAGEKGKRYALPHARIMLHQPMGGTSGQASDIQIAAKEMERTKKTLVKILSEKTGQSEKVVEQKIDRDFWLTPEEAKSFGVIDQVLTPRSS